jgi:hypothetical protein
MPRAVSHRKLPVLAGGLLAFGMVLATGSPPGSDPAAVWAAAVAPSPAIVRLVDLKVEMEPAMFRGTVEAVDLHNFSVTIRTDFGHLLSLTDTDCGMVGGLRQGDRVALQLDAQEQITIKRLEQAADEVTPAFQAESSDRSVTRCAQGAF